MNTTPEGHEHIRTSQLRGENIVQAYNFCIDVMRKISSQNSECKAFWQDANGGNLERRKLPRASQIYAKCVQHAAKPNVHLVNELLHQETLMWPHPAWSGEISLKRAHQRVKRILAQNNNKDQHLFCYGYTALR